MRKCAYGGSGMYTLVKSIKALSDETRIRIINLLAERECCVCEVVQAMQISQTRASRNLSMLYDAGFLKLRKEGLWSLYSLDKASLPGHLVKLVEAVETALARNKTALSDRKRLQSATRTGSSCAKKNNETCSNG
jgi:ArsR family transcriptional regulator, arsenate/arsenite/antimonite-responsive transcriptional repressor